MDNPKDKKLYESVGNYTRYKLIERLISKHKGTKLDSLDKIETLADDVIGILSLCGMQYYNDLKGQFNK